ncbi:MAG: hypothetical protein K2X47_14350, partial [Bdellovibrionales bacterium]|nr:hypothetical protein [Bdellovibrionales bacterium]
ITFPDQLLQMTLSGRAVGTSLASTAGTFQAPRITPYSGEPDIARLLDQIQSNSRAVLEGYGATDIVCPRLVPGVDFTLFPGLSSSQTIALLESLSKCSGKFGGYSTSNENGFINPFELSRCEDRKSKAVLALSALDPCEKAWTADMSLYQCANSLTPDRNSYNVSREVQVGDRQFSTAGGYNSFLNSCRQALNIRSSFQRSPEEVLQILERAAPGLYQTGERTMRIITSSEENQESSTVRFPEGGVTNCGEYPADCICGSTTPGYTRTFGPPTSSFITRQPKDCEGKPDGAFVDQDPDQPNPAVVKNCGLTPPGATIVAYSQEIGGFAIQTSAGCQ